MDEVMPFPFDQIAWLATNRDRVARYFFIPQLLVALLFLGFAYHTGHFHARLVVQGAHTQGRIVSFRSVRMSDRPGSRLSDTDTVNLPLIEFTANNRVIRFEEWKGSQTDPGVGAFVPVLYDPADASVAMMDRGTWNWLPWAPCFAIGLLLSLAAITGIFSFLRFLLLQPASHSEIRP
jgi:Protein of unknown function (DUF3592)